MHEESVTLRQQVGAIIPIFRDAKMASWCLTKFNPQAIDTVCLVIDEPHEQEMVEVRQAAEKSGIHIHIIKNKTRSGIGASIKQGLEYLHATGHEIVVIMAGNGKDDPAELEKLTEPILSGRSDYVQGSRYLSRGLGVRTPLTRSIFNRLYPAVWTIVTHKRCTDVTNGFRAYKLSILEDPEINLQQKWLDGYSLEYYLHYKILTLNYRMLEVPVSKTYSSRRRGGYSRIQPLKDWWPIISPLALLFLGVRD